MFLEFIVRLISASKEKEECRHMETLIGELSGFGVSLPQEMLRDMLAKKSGQKDRSLEREIEKPQGKSVLRNSTGGESHHPVLLLNHSEKGVRFGWASIYIIFQRRFTVTVENVYCNAGLL